MTERETTKHPLPIQIEQVENAVYLVSRRGEYVRFDKVKKP